MKLFKKIPNFLKSVSIVLIVSMIGKVLGFIKQIILAMFFGATEQTDLFFTSYFFIIEIAAAFFSTISVVFLSAYGKNKKKGKDFVNNLFSSTVIIFTIIALILSILLFIFPKICVNIIAPGYTLELKEQLCFYIKILSPIMIIYCLQQIFNTILEYEKKFLPAKTLTIILNLSIILFTMILSKKYGIVALIVSVVFAYIIQLIISFISAKGYIKFLITNPLKNNEFKNMLKLYIPLFISNAITEINSIVDRSIASTLNDGAVSSITYAASLNEIVTVLLIGTISSVFYSYIVTMINSDKNRKDISNYLKKVIKIMLIILIPINILFLFNAKDIVALVYMRGNFDYSSVITTSTVVIGYAIGFIPLMIRMLLIRIHYAFDDAKRPMINGFVTVLVNIILSIIFTKNFGIIGISLATSISFVISMIMCIFTIRKHINLSLTKQNIIFIIKLIITLIILLLGNCIINYFININTIINIIIVCLYIFIAYVILLQIFNLYKIKDILKMIKNEK